MKRWHVTVGDKEVECILHMAYTNFCKVILIFNERLFAVTFNDFDEYVQAKNGCAVTVSIESMNKSKTVDGSAVFKTTKANK